MVTFAEFGTGLQVCRDADDSRCESVFLQVHFFERASMLDLVGDHRSDDDPNYGFIGMVRDRRLGGFAMRAQLVSAFADWRDLRARSAHSPEETGRNDEGSNSSSLSDTESETSKPSRDPCSIESEDMSCTSSSDTSNSQGDRTLLQGFKGTLQTPSPQQMGMEAEGHSEGSGGEGSSPIGAPVWRCADLLVTQVSGVVGAMASYGC